MRNAGKSSYELSSSNEGNQGEAFSTLSLGYFLFAASAIHVKWNFPRNPENVIS